MAVHVRVHRRVPGEAPASLGVVEVPLERGVSETSDKARAAAREAAARHGGVRAEQVTINHVVGGGFVAYLPATSPR